MSPDFANFRACAGFEVVSMRPALFLVLWFFAFGAALLLLVDPLAEVYVRGVPSDPYVFSPLVLSLVLNAFLTIYAFRRLVAYWILVYRGLAWPGPGTNG